MAPPRRRSGTPRHCRGPAPDIPHPIPPPIPSPQAYARTLAVSVATSPNLASALGGLTAPADVAAAYAAAWDAAASAAAAAAGAPVDWALVFTHDCRWDGSGGDWAGVGGGTGPPSTGPTAGGEQAPPTPAA